MGFNFGLGLNTMVNELQRDAGSVKLTEMAQNINANYANLGHAATLVDFTYDHRDYLENKEQDLDNSATFMFEFQALLQSKIQELVNKLTAALTKDLDVAMLGERATWNSRPSMQGFTQGAFPDAGAARVSYNFFTGYADTGTVQAAGSATSTPNTVPYVGQNIPSTGLNHVQEDTPADARFGDIRSTGTASIQQGILEDGVTVGILDSLRIGLSTFEAVNPLQSPGIVNGTTGYHQALDRHKYDIQYTNNRVPENLNDSSFVGPVDSSMQAIAVAKNQFQMALALAISELEANGWLRDALTLSEEMGLFENLQIASSTTTPSGSQVQVQVILDYVPNSAARPDLGGSIDIVFDKWTAFYHS